MPYGGYHPFPKRYGGAASSDLETVHKSLNQQKGTAFDAQNSRTFVWLENMAYARGIVFDGWEVNRRMSCQWDPRKTTDMLSRWEKIFTIPITQDPPYVRRQRLTLRWQAFGKLGNATRLHDELLAACGAFFVGVEYISPAVANVHVPDNTYPWGTVVAGITWYSTVAHILVRMQKPAGATEGDFYAAAAKVAPTLDAIVPIWVTFDWYRASGTPIAVAGGPSGGGFFLDTPSNLDNQVFDD